MAMPERVLRLSGHYHRRPGKSEEEFHHFARDHAVKCAKIHEKYGVLKYQIACSSSSAQALARSMETPYAVNTHDLEIEFYFEDVASLLAVSNDEEFQKLHMESEDFVEHETVKVTLTWIEVYLDNAKMINVDSTGESTYSSFAELSDIKMTDVPTGKYYEKKVEE
ncbi:hypothetical protein F5Y18DRAFT_401103 [Xylariaceae sp. FL1019]|nr:hypothetical protein F5Y18DRAFT_401103 [Xylariaceae sp. FL1019]